MKNKERIELLFELLASLPDETQQIPPQEEANPKGKVQNQKVNANIAKNTEKFNAAGAKKWEEEEQKAVN